MERSIDVISARGTNVHDVIGNIRRHLLDLEIRLQAVENLQKMMVIDPQLQGQDHSHETHVQPQLPFSW